MTRDFIISHKFIRSVFSNLEEFLDDIRQSQDGKFFPCADGLTPLGKRLSLGFSCLALKTYYISSLWDYLPNNKQKSWLEFIKSFQQTEDKFLKKSSFLKNAFVDYPLFENYRNNSTFKTKVKKFFYGPSLSIQEKIILGETKQAISTLNDIGDFSYHPYLGFLVHDKDLLKLFNSFDWTRPWGAGGLLSAYATLLKIGGVNKEKELKQSRIIINFIKELVNRNTGGYYKKQEPKNDEIVNGAMKILTALDHLKSEIHYPKELIDLCLNYKPVSEGCYLVNTIYVVYRCSCQLDNNYRYYEIQKYVIGILDLIKTHLQKDRGFSYLPVHSQTDYYGTIISEGKRVGDIHGTTLLIWSLAMISKLLEFSDIKVNLIKP